MKMKSVEIERRLETIPRLLKKGMKAVAVSMGTLACTVKAQEHIQFTPQVEQTYVHPCII
jgi:hypothetical protein